MVDGHVVDVALIGGAALIGFHYHGLLGAGVVLVVLSLLIAGVLGA